MTFRQAVQDSLSIASCLRLLGRAAVGSNYRWLKKRVAQSGCSTAHWKGKAHGTSKQVMLRSEEVCKKESVCSTGVVKCIVRRENLIPYVCALCHMEPFWNGRPLVLRLDHENGVRNDHRVENLRFLCPNCDSQTDTYCGKNKSALYPRGKCRHCGKPSARGRCRSCGQKMRIGRKTKIAWPSRQELLARIAREPVVAVARQLGVSDNAVRKHLRFRARVVEGEGL